ncbi:MAG TPA: hypothetical protein VNS63_08520 [Blastocatellia bacterium]|nr:hypothetical protein [Blastocatellia bacterium]
MKRASLLAFAVLSLVVVTTCTSQSTDKNRAAAAAAMNCFNPSTDVVPVNLTLSYAKQALTVDGIHDVYLKHGSAGDKIKWHVENTTSQDVTVTVDTFINLQDTSDTKPFPSTNDFTITVKKGEVGETKPSDSIPSYGMCKTFKYKITFTLQGITGLTTLVLDPRVVVGD